MKMKKVTLSFSILAISALLVISCKKKTPNEAPEADTEVQSSIDAAYATYLISDIDMATSFSAENTFLKHFYTEIPGTAGTLGAGTGSFTAIRDISANEITFAWNKTKCLDGRLRSGSIFLYWGYNPLWNPTVNLNAKYAHDFEFKGRIVLVDFRVDGWLIENLNGSEAYLKNTLSSDNWNPSITNITWTLEGKFKFTHPSDSTKNMTWDGKLYKTLVNTSNKDVFTLQKVGTPQTPINWNFAVVNYYGAATGVTSGNVPYAMLISQTNPLTRDFTCSSDKVGGVSIDPITNSVVVRYEEHHPIISGITSFTTGFGTPKEKYRRQIYFANEGLQNPDLLVSPCDNTGEVLIKGISYPITFMK